MSKRITIDHDPEATFMYMLRLPDSAEDIFNENTTVSAAIEVPTEHGVNLFPATAEWEGCSRTRIRVNAGSLLGMISAKLVVKIVHEGNTFTTDAVNIRMVN